VPNRHPSPRRRAALAALSSTAVLVAAAPASASAAEAPDGGTTHVQLLAFNDFHGTLEPPTGSGGRTQVGVDAEGAPVAVDTGGVEHLATALAELTAQAEEGATLTVSPGDLVGASPLLSAAFHDEPTIEALGLAGLDVASVGNHEFDEGSAELVRLAEGGCHPIDGCADGTPFEGAEFDYLAANVIDTETGEPLLPPYSVEEAGGVEVGFIGVTLEGTGDIVSQQGVAGLEFADEAETVDRYAAELREEGVETIVVLLHQGSAQTGPRSYDVDGCSGLTGPVAEIVEAMDDSVDVVLTAHTHQAYTCEVDGRLVTSASSAGRLVTDIDLAVDTDSGDVVAASADNVLVARDIAPDPAQTELIARYREALGPIATRVVGVAAGPLVRAQETLFTGADGAPVLGESPLGNVVADAQLAATDDEQGAVAAFMNPGGVRADLDAGEITYEEAFTVQPFANNLVTLDLTGAQVQCLLEQQFAVGRTLYPSAGVAYAVDPAGTSAAAGADPCAGTRVVDESVTIAGQPVAADGTYRVTVNNYIAGGGDGFTVLTEGANAVTGALDLDALTAYLGATQPLAAPADDRVRVVG
jgi:5'-nucleotidase